MNYWSLFLCVAVLGCSSYKEKDIDHENVDNYYQIQGKVYRVRTYFDWRHLEKSRDVFYEYHFDLDTALRGEIKHTSLMGLSKGSYIVVVVNKDDINDSYYNGRGMIGDKILRLD